LRDESREAKELLEVALSRLDPELRAVFLLSEAERLSYREIADAIEIPEGTVGSRLNRARRELRSILTNLGWEP
jgi:RNA polymerase sigma-70 factor (ECF subfamily)